MILLLCVIRIMYNEIIPWVLKAYKMREGVFSGQTQERTGSTLSEGAAPCIR
jgi:hypothetical protein